MHPFWSSFGYLADLGFVCKMANYSGKGRSKCIFRLLAAITLRNVLGTKNLGDILSEQDSIATAMQELLHEATFAWGVMIERVEVKDVRVPEQLMRAMAAEAEDAEGEHKASRALKLAAEIIADNPEALQVDYN
jgi:erythrocyte band 7 integral membrane protein